MRLDHLLLGRKDKREAEDAYPILSRYGKYCRISFLFVFNKEFASFEKGGIIFGRGYSSAGRAPALQAGGHRFEPDYLHHQEWAHSSAG